MALISWTGGVLRHVWENTPASRLNNWMPGARVVGPRHILLGSGAPRVYRFRADHTAQFEFRDIPNTAMGTMVALQLHLSGGGIVSVETTDAQNRIYANCALAPDADPPEITLSDPQQMRYTMAFALVNLDAKPMIAVYA